MYLRFHGAAGEVTGSMHQLVTESANVTLDCGLFQGRRAEAAAKNREVPKWAINADALLLSHAHLDHSGNIPSLVRRGYEGNIYCTPATRDLCSVMLRDSATIQAQDARYLNKKRRTGEAKVEPLYDTDDVQRAIGQMISVPLDRRIPLTKQTSFRFADSAHVLGSALVVVDAEERGVRRRVLFTGDLGRPELPLLADPDHIDDVDVLLMESTYGDRLHPPLSGTDASLAKLVNDTVERGGRVYVPTFALERAQEILFALVRLHEADAIARVPIYIDAPLAISITEVYKLHPDYLAPEIRERILERDDPFAPPGLKSITRVEDSIALQGSDKPCIIIAGSGMCEGGRIVHHLRGALGNPNNTIVIVGFMAQHTLGRRLVEHRKTVRVLGVERDVHAQVHRLDGLSAHADRDDLIRFAVETTRRGKVRQIILVHGEDEPRESLAEALREACAGVKVLCPMRGDEIPI